MEQSDIGNEMNWLDWLKEAIKKEHIKYYDYNHFKDIKEIDSGGFGKVSRTTWNMLVLIS